MSYLVLARKYRPQRFEDVIGQEHITRTLRHAIEQDRVHHAYLFAGARGLGKTTTARILAKALVCERGPTADPCNECRQCVAVTQGNSVDVIEIDGASNNSVDNIRNLREQVNYLPQSARRKVYIIDEVHMLTTAAFNALLKTLEEPPAHVSFLFATTEAQKLLPTILSRVSRFDFRRVSGAELVTHLRGILEQEQLALADGGLQLVARCSGGSVRDSLTLLDQVIAFAAQPSQITEDEARKVLGQTDRAAVIGLIGAVLDRDAERTLAQFDEIVAAGQDLVVLSQQVLEHLRDLMVVKLCHDPSVLDAVVGATESEYAELRELAVKAEASVLGQLFDRFARIADELPASRVQRLLLEMGLLDLVHADRMVPLDQLVDRLERIAGGGGGGGSSEPGRGPAAAKPEPRPGGGGQRRRASAAPLDQPPARTQAQTTDIGQNSFTRNLWNLAKEQGVVTQPVAAAPEEAPARSADVEDRGAPLEPDPAPTEPATMAGADRIPWTELEPFGAWEQLVSRIRATDEFLSAVLSELGLSALCDGVVRVAAPARSFAHTQFTTRAEIRSGLEQALLQHFGAALQIELIDGEPALPELPSIVLVEGQRRAEHRAIIEREAREHPAISEVVRTFEGELRAIKPHREP